MQTSKIFSHLCSTNNVQSGINLQSPVNISIINIYLLSFFLPTKGIFGIRPLPYREVIHFGIVVDLKSVGLPSFGTGSY
jgi:hypothetical protein